MSLWSKIKKKAKNTWKNAKNTAKDVWTASKKVGGTMRDIAAEQIGDRIPVVGEYVSTAIKEGPKAGFNKAKKDVTELAKGGLRKALEKGVKHLSGNEKSD